MPRTSPQHNLCRKVFPHTFSNLANLVPFKPPALPVRQGLAIVLLMHPGHRCHLYRARVGGGGSFSASPVAADGRLYFANEDGDVYVARAGRAYEEIAKNEMKEVIMSTPAISDGVMVVRTLGHVYGIGQK